MARLRADILAEQKRRADWLLSTPLDAPALTSENPETEEPESCPSPSNANTPV
jgi:hypothetical protein